MPTAPSFGSNHGTRRARSLAWLALSLAGVIFLTSCSTVPTKPTASPGQQQLQSALESKDPQQIAQARMALANQLQGEARAKGQMQAIETAIDAEDYDLAQQLYAKADTQALWPTISPQRAALLSGFHEWRQDQPLNALNTVRNLPVPLTNDEARRRLLLLADVFMTMGQPMDAARQRSALNGMLNSNQVQNNIQALWHALEQVPADKLDSAMKQATDPDFANWLGLALLERTRPAELQTWIDNHPNHAAVTSGFAAELLKKGASFTVTAPTGTGPIVVLLPESGNYKPISDAIKKGMTFAKAQLGLDPNQALSFIDSGTTPDDLTQALSQAYAQQPSVIIGPLLKPQIPALTNRPNNGIPVLALNAPDDDTPLPSGVISFSLSPEEEGRETADRMIADHHMNALMYAADNDLGHRMAAAWSREYTLLGGKIVDQAFYDPEATDFSGQLQDLLQVDSPKKGPFQPTIRNDVDSIFLGGTGPQVAMIVPQLDYFGANQLARYGTSLAYSGNPNKLIDQDKDGLIIPVEPLLLAANATPDNPLRATWEQASLDTPLPRLFGFGADALLVATHLQQLLQHQTLNGLTGQLKLSTTGVVDRLAPFGQFRNGLLAPATSNDSGPQPSTILTTEPNGEMSDTGSGSSSGGNSNPNGDQSGSTSGASSGNASNTAPQDNNPPVTGNSSSAMPNGNPTAVQSGNTQKSKTPTFTDGGGLVTPTTGSP